MDKQTLDTENIIGLLAFHEEVISRLYKVFANRFTDDRDFWLELSIEEIEHANWLHKLTERACAGEANLKAHMFKKPALENSINYIEGLIKNHELKIISKTNALSVAVDLEKSLLESRYFQVFESDFPETIETLHALERSTKEHLERVTQLLKEETIS